MNVLWEMQAPRAVYVHVPFCRRRCFYCDFPISVVGDRLVGESSGMMAEYVRALIQEIELEPNRGLSQGLSLSLKTVFFGGGTPSLLSPGQVKEILLALERKFGFEAGIEISMEVDPGTFDLERLRSWMAAGVNRFSLGVQAFQDELLAACGRSHRVVDVWKSVDFFRSAGVNNWSLDLMSGLPGQTLEMWSESLELAIQTGSTHLSVYDLTVEPETVFGKREARGVLNVPLEEDVVEMYRSTALRLVAAGFGRYEVSSYARDTQFECRHNRVYWEGLPFYGFGMGATSFVDGGRFSRARTRSEYFAWVEGLDPDERPPNPQFWGDRAGEGDRLGDRLDDRLREIFLERVMMGLRLVKGVEIAPLVDRFGAELVAEAIGVLTEFVASGLVTIEAGWVRLSDPEGLLMSNVVLVKLFEVMEK
jgi:putative oxygen-independent coproporphyrinogen III oxidase